MRNTHRLASMIPCLFGFHGALGCATVLGLDKASLDEAAGVGGTTNRGGSSHSGGTTKSTGHGGTGRGGSGASTPSGTACGDVVQPDIDLVRACVVGNSCDPLVPTHSLSMCITYDTPNSCINAAYTCADVADCYKRQWDTLNLCNAQDVGWKCDGSLAIKCSNAPAWSVDCNAFGGTCELYTGSSTEMAWPCRLTPTTSCLGTEGLYWCDGSIRYTCLDGKRYGIDCAGAGMNCVEDTTGEAYCSETAATCPYSNTSTCSNNAVQLCNSTGHAMLFSCERGGGNCETDGALGWYCPAPGCLPEDEANCTEECLDISLMKVCVGGAPYSVDCADYGFAECVVYTDPQDSSNYVGCQ